MALYVAIIFYADINKFSLSFLNIKIEYLPAILLSSFVAFLIRSKRQQLLFKKIGLNLSYKKNVLLYLSGLSMIATPAGTGTMIKSHYIKKKIGNAKSQTIPAILVERLLDLLGISSFVAITLFFYDSLSGKLLTIISFVLISVGFIVLKNRKLLTLLLSKISKIRYLDNILEGSAHLVESSSLMTNKKILVEGWTLTMASMIFDAIAIYLSFLSFNVQFDYILTTQLSFISILFGALSFVPGGLGFTEGSLIALLVHRKIELSTSSSLVLLIRLTTLWFATILGFIAARAFLTKKAMD